MTLSLISVAVLFITALVIVIEVVRAINRGRQKTLVSLASIISSIFLSMFITKFLSKLLANHVMEMAQDKYNINLDSLSEKLPSIESVLYAYFDSLAAPVMFFIIFIVLRILIAIVVKIVYNINEKNAHDMHYEHEDAPEHKKKPKFINGLLGALSGFLVVVVAASPIMGTLKMASKSFKHINEDSDVFKIKLNQNAVWYFDACSDDLVGNVLYYCGGNLFYKSVASSKLNDNYFGLEREIDNTFASVSDLAVMPKILNNLSTATEDEKNMLKTLGGKIDKAETLKSATADILPELSKKWLSDEPYQGAHKPKVNKVCENFLDKMLRVCKQSNPDTVGADLSTLLNVYILVFENNMITSENYKELIEQAKLTGAFELIKEELNKNSRMSAISFDVDTMTVKAIATAIQTHNVENYELLVTNFALELNNTIGIKDDNDKLDSVTDITRRYITLYGINAGDDVTSEVAERLVDELVDGKEIITVDDLKSFFDKYSVTPNVSGDANSNNTNNNNGNNGNDIVGDGDTVNSEDSGNSDGTNDDEEIITNPEAPSQDGEENVEGETGNEDGEEDNQSGVEEKPIGGGVALG